MTNFCRFGGKYTRPWTWHLAMQKVTKSPTTWTSRSASEELIGLVELESSRLRSSPLPSFHDNADLPLGATWILVLLRPLAALGGPPSCADTSEAIKREKLRQETGSMKASGKKEIVKIQTGSLPAPPPTLLLASPASLFLFSPSVPSFIQYLFCGINMT